MRRCQMWEDLREDVSERRCEKMWDVRRCQMWEDVREDVRCEKMSDVRKCAKIWDVRRCQKWEDVRRYEMWEDVRFEDLLYVHLFTPPSFWKTLRSDALGKKGCSLVCVVSTGMRAVSEVCQQKVRPALFKHRFGTIFVHVQPSQTLVIVLYRFEHAGRCRQTGPE